MRKFALRKLFTILAEKIARMDNHLEKKHLEKYSEFILLCQNSLSEIKTEFLKNKDLLIASYTEEDIPSDMLIDALLSLKKCTKGFLDLHSLLNHLPGHEISPETFVFLDETLKAHIKHHIVLTNHDYTLYNTKAADNPFFSKIKNTYPLFVPTIDNTNPLMWSITFKNIFKNSSLEEKIEKILDESNISQEEVDSFKKLAHELACDIFGARIMGPSYLAMISEYEAFLACQNPLRYSDFLIKEKIIIENIFRNELTENTHAFTEELKSVYSENRKYPENVLNKIAGLISQELDLLINKSFNFSNSDMIKCLSAAKRLDQQVFISADYVYDLDETRKYYEDVIKKSNKYDVYQHLNQLKEIPNTSKQIINAGWIYKNKSIDQAFIEMLHSDDEFGAMETYQQKLDDLLIKSIEISNIHKVLLSED